MTDPEWTADDQAALDAYTDELMREGWIGSYGRAATILDGTNKIEWEETEFLCRNDFLSVGRWRPKPPVMPEVFDSLNRDALEAAHEGRLWNHNRGVQRLRKAMRTGELYRDGGSPNGWSVKQDGGAALD